MSPTRSTRELGAWGEELACRELEQRGYTILDRNWRCAQGEVDIVALDGATYAFVEVKTRKSRLESPLQAIRTAKVTRLARLAELYLAQDSVQPGSWRIDWVGVQVDSASQRAEISLVQGIGADV